MLDKIYQIDIDRKQNTGGPQMVVYSLVFATYSLLHYDVLCYLFTYYLLITNKNSLNTWKPQSEFCILSSCYHQSEF